MSIYTNTIHKVCSFFRPVTTRRPKLVPLQGIEPFGDYWVCSRQEAEPCFLLQDNLLRSGWYMVGLKAEVGSPSGNARLVLGTGSENDPDLPFPFINKVLSKRIVRLSGNTRKIFFYPLESYQHKKVKLQILDLRFVFLLPSFARELMLQRIGNRYPVFQGFCQEEITEHLKEKGQGYKVSLNKLIIEYYNMTFVRHLDHGQKDYNDWINYHEHTCMQATQDSAAESAQPAKNHLQAHSPLISILLPASGASEYDLCQSLNSVLAQDYQHWEVLVASDAVQSLPERKLLNDYTAKDQRIKSIFEPLNPGKFIQGNYTAILEPGDELTGSALEHVAGSITSNPQAALLYSDHDLLDENKKRCSPHFKPDWSPDLFMGHNYIAPLAVYRSKIFMATAAENDQALHNVNHDFNLFFAARIRDDQVVHIPKVLYHRSARNANKDLNTQDREDHASGPALPGLETFLQSRGLSGCIECANIAEIFRFRPDLPDPAPLVSIIIPTRDNLDLLSTSLNSILEKTTYPNFELLIINNQSQETATLNWLQEIQKDSRIRILDWDHPFNYSKLNNFAVTMAKGELLALLNNDIEVLSPQWLTEMAAHAWRPDIGCVGAKLLYPDDSVQHGGVILGLGGVAGHSHRHFSADHPGYLNRLQLVQNLSAVTAACLVMRKQVFEQVGGLEPELAGAFNDVDLCLKVARAGFYNLWTPYALLYHHESKSRGFPDNPVKREQYWFEQNFMKNKWKDVLQNDPFYNPNLTLEFEDFSLRSFLHEPDAKNL